jgi:drug/metabolite transporter superfamily protein YnfA
MSTVKRAEMNAARRWLVPAVCLLAACGYLAVFLAAGKVGLAIACAAIMLAYGGILVVFSRRSEVAAILRDDGRDERRAAINLRASALALQVLVVVALTMLFVELAQGHNPGAWGTICAVGGGAYIAGIIFFSRRG